eukprot:PRCOL_00006135-RA
MYHSSYAHLRSITRPGQGEGEPPTGLVPLLGRSGADAVVFRAAGAPPPGAIDPAGGAADGLTGGARGDGADGLTSAPWDLTALAKPSASQRRTSLLRFTCETCGALNFHMVNPRAFASGTIFARCSSCGITHTVVDHLNLASSVHERARFVRQNMHHNGLSDKRARDWTVSDGVLDEGEEEAMFQGHAAWWRMALAVALCWLVAWSDSILGSAWAYGQLRRLGVELAPKVADALPAAGSTLVVGRRAVVLT